MTLACGRAGGTGYGPRALGIGAGKQAIYGKDTQDDKGGEGA